MPVAERRQREKEARRLQILDAAREIFFAKGFESATIEEIADKTELSKGALYLYFSSKEEIYITLMLEGSQILYGMLKKSVSKNLPADTLLRHLGQAYLRFYREYTEYFRMLFLYYSSLSIHQKLGTDLCERCELQAKQSLELVAGIIQKGVDQGLFKPCNAMDQAVLTWTCQNGIILLGERGDDHLLRLNTSVEKLHDLYMESFIASLKTGR